VDERHVCNAGDSRSDVSIARPPRELGRLLEGLRVIEMASFVAVPYAGMSLAQLGADVIRIDPEGGGPDIGRWPLAENGQSLYWAGLNKAKRSVVLNTRELDDQAQLLRIFAESGSSGGIIVTNFAARDWLRYSDLARTRSDAVLVEVTGYAHGGNALDYTVNSAVGLPFLTAPVGSTIPQNHVLPAWDLLTGMHVAMAVLAADRRRRQTGVGAHLRVPMFDVAVAALASLGWLAESEISGGREADGNFVYGAFGADFITADGQRVMVVPITERQWAALTTISGVADALRKLGPTIGVDFDLDIAARYVWRRLIRELLAPWFRARSLAEVNAVLTDAGIPSSPFQTLDELTAGLVRNADDDAVVQRVEQPGIGPILSSASPLIMVDAPGPRWAHAAPDLGEDTAALLSTLHAQQRVRGPVCGADDGQAAS
jgi:2-methylfumaryl-CoA isomerase